MKIRDKRKPLTDQDRRVVSDFMAYMRDGAEVGEAIKRLAVRQTLADMATRGAGSPRRYGR